MSSSSLAETWTVTGAAVAADPAAAQRAAVHELHDPREVADGVGGDLRALVVRAELAQDARDRFERRAVQRVGAGRRHDGVEDQRFDVLGVLLGVLLGDLGAVGGAPQHELFVAPRAAQRLDVGDGVGGGVEGAFGPDLVGARGGQLPGGAVGAGRFEAVAGERVRVAGAALVEDELIARVEDRAEQFGEVFGERDRGLPRAAGERDDRGARFPDGRAAAADRERDGPRRAPRRGRAGR